MGGSEHAAVEDSGSVFGPEVEAVIVYILTQIRLYGALYDKRNGGT